MSARTMTIKAATRACRLNKRDKEPCTPNPIGNDGNRGASLVITAQDIIREPHKFIHKTTRERHRQLAARIDTKRNIQEQITIKDFVTFQDSSWRTLQQTLQQGVPAKSPTHTPGTIGGELVFYISKGIITQNRTTAGVSKSLSDAQLGCQTYDYNLVTNRVLNTVASIQDDAQWNRLFAVASQGILNTNRLNMSKDRCIAIDQDSFKDGDIIRAHTTAFEPIGSSSCIPPYDPCRPVGVACTIPGWTLNLLGEEFGAPIAGRRDFILMASDDDGASRATPCCPGLSCGAVVGGGSVDDGNGNKVWPSGDEDTPMVYYTMTAERDITVVSWDEERNFGEPGTAAAIALNELEAEKPEVEGWCWYIGGNKWKYKLPDEAAKILGVDTVTSGDIYNTDLFTGSSVGNCIGPDNGDDDDDEIIAPPTTVYNNISNDGGISFNSVANKEQQVLEDYTDIVSGFSVAEGETVTILAKFADNVTIKIEKNNGQVLNIPGEKVQNSGVPEE